MTLNFKNVKTNKETSGFSPQFLTWGVNLLKINHIELKVSTTDKYQVKFWVEGPELGDGFQGASLPDETKAKGLVGKANLGVYFDPDDEFKMNSMISNLMFIAEKAGVADRVAEIEAESFLELLEKYLEIIKGRFMWFTLRAEEWDKGKYIFSLKEGKVGVDEDGKKIFQVYCKSEAFSEGTDDLVDGRIYKLKGINVIGSSIGKTDTLEFNPDYDLKEFEESDYEEPQQNSKGEVDVEDAF